MSSAVLIPIVFGIIWFGGWLFTGFVTLCIVIALHEWMNIAKSLVLRILGIFYLSFSIFEIIYLRNSSEGLFYTFVFMLCIWASDSGAYLFGKTIGGPKMSPTISPNKTWSGYIGAILFPALVLLCFHFIFSESLSISSLLFGIAIGIAGQSGDLMISAMKRKAGLKDTGTLIPGHGGILDRIDALLLALPVYLAYVMLVAE